MDTPQIALIGDYDSAVRAHQAIPQALTLAVRKGLVKDAELRHWLVRDVLGALFG